MPSCVASPRLVGGTVGTREETVSEALVKEDAKCIGVSKGDASSVVSVLCAPGLQRAVDVLPLSDERPSLLLYLDCVPPMG